MRVVATGGYDGRLTLWDIDRSPSAPPPRTPSGAAPAGAAEPATEPVAEHVLFERVALLRGVALLSTTSEDERRGLARARARARARALVCGCRGRGSPFEPLARPGLQNITAAGSRSHGSALYM